MSLSDKKIALGLTLKIKDGDKIIEVPLSDFIDVNKIKIQSEADIQNLVDSTEKFILDNEDAVAATIASTLIDDTPEYTAPTSASSKKKDRTALP